MRRTTSRIAVGLLILLATTSLLAQDLSSFEERTTMRTLDNGLTVIVVERHEAPVFSFFTHVDTGADRETIGITGLAHMFEHMAFKGTDQIGTTDYQAELEALEKVEEAYHAYDRARRAPQGTDPQRLEELEQAWQDAMDAADEYVVSNEFGEIIDRVGGVGLNAFTSYDETGYFYSFPANQLELWAYLESERFLNPVMREFYKERDVVMEERRMRTESNPIGRLIEQFLATAFTAHPYGRPVVGWPSDLQTFSATDAMEFYEEYYVPANMVVTLVGNLNPDEVWPIVEKYLGRLPAAPEPAPLRTVEPEQFAEREVVIVEETQPFYVEGYQKPAGDHPDAAIYDAIADIMSSGRTSRLYRSLVRDKKIAAVAAGFNDFPGDKYRNLFAFYAVPTPGHTPEEMQEAIREEIEKLKSEKVSEAELEMVKTKAKANLLRQLRSNQGMALQFGSYQARYGDWRELFREVDKIEAVTADDVLRVANEAFVAKNRTVGMIKSTQMAEVPAEGGNQ
ncbi:MAG: pitrilysin family protein [Thermoanaerobaculia bacterium]|nr:pitrilysin family protein [Thermoanaerobaculia bacterium]